MEKKDNRGVMFVNDRKEKDTHPDRRGEIMVAGVMYWISGWLQTSKDGNTKYMSLSVQPKGDLVPTPASAQPFHPDAMAQDYEQKPFINSPEPQQAPF